VELKFKYPAAISTKCAEVWSPLMLSHNSECINRFIIICPKCYFKYVLDKHGIQKRFVRNKKRFVRNEMSLSEMKCVCQKRNNLVKMKRFLTNGKSFSITDNGKSFSITDNGKSFSITDNHYSYLMQCFIVNFFVFVRNEKRFVRNEKRFNRNEMSLSEMKCVLVKMKRFLTHGKSLFSITDNGKSLFSITDNGKSLFSITDNGKSLFSITDNRKLFSITDNHYSYLVQCFIVNFFVF